MSVAPTMSAEPVESAEPVMPTNGVHLHVCPSGRRIIGPNWLVDGPDEPRNITVWKTTRHPDGIHLESRVGSREILGENLYFLAVSETGHVVATVTGPYDDHAWVVETWFTSTGADVVDPASCGDEDCPSAEGISLKVTEKCVVIDPGNGRAPTTVPFPVVRPPPPQA